jgi:hypothetical protein
MTEPPTADSPIDVPEADLLEQRIPWQVLPEEATTDGPAPLAVTERVADEGDLVEQARAVVPGLDDDDHPYGAPG